MGRRRHRPNPLAALREGRLYTVARAAQPTGSEPGATTAHLSYALGAQARALCGRHGSRSGWSLRPSPDVRRGQLWCGQCLDNYAATYGAGSGASPDADAYLAGLAAASVSSIHTIGGVS